MSPKKKPERVKFRSISLPLYKHIDRRSGRESWRFAWPDSSVKGGWRYGSRRTKKDAKAAAHARAVEIANQQPDLSGLDSHQARLCSEFLAMGPTWEDLSTLRRLKSTDKIALGAAVDRFISQKLATKGKLTHHLQVLRHDLLALSAELGPQVPLLHVPAKEIAEWLDTRGCGPKRRNDYRAAAVALWRWAAKNDLLPAAPFSEPEKIPLLPVPPFTVRILSPEETEFLLQHVAPAFMPWLVLALFSGLRTGEIRANHKPPLVWERVHTDRNIIEVPPELSKTGRRKLVPILPVLSSWLKTFGRRKGAVIAEPAWMHETGRLGDLLDVEFKRIEGWPTNAPRHSYGSYRVADIRDIPAVSLEMDNSPAIIRRHYLESTTKDEAARYFGLTHRRVFGRM